MKRNTQWIAIATGIVLAVLTAVPYFAQQTSSQNQRDEVALRAAMERETVQGDLKGAIEQYKKIAQSKDRSVAARALIRMAEAYRNLGDAESRNIYEQVLRDYGDQKEAVTIARARLRGETATQNAGIVTRQVWTGSDVNLSGSGLIAGDGRYLFFVDGQTNDLALRDLTNGKVRRLTNYVRGETAWEPVVSPDGKQVAYRRRAAIALSNLKADHSQLRLIGLNGTDLATAKIVYDRVLYDNEDVNGIAAKDWSPDGKWIAIQIVREGKDRLTQIGMVSVSDGSLRVLKTIDWRYAGKVFFSPDGKYLAFDLQSSEKQPEQRDVFVLATDGSREIPAVVHQANDIVMGWTPDGTHLLFASDRNGAMGLWALPFRDGTSQGAAQLVKADIGTARSLGVTRAGTLFFGVRTQGSAVYTSSVDFNSGKVLTTPRQELAGSDPNEVDWSPDGKYLAYRTSNYPLRFQDALTVRSVETGQIRELRPNLYSFTRPRWAPDGGSFMVQGSDIKHRRGIYRVDAQTAEVSPLVLGLPEAEAWDVDYNPQWAPDGKRMFYRANEAVIIERNLASGKERELWHGKSPALGLSVAPDGRYIAFHTSDPVTRESRLLVVPVAGGESRELIRVRAPQALTTNWMEWTRDSRSIIVHGILRDATAEGGMRQYWLVPLAGGQPRPLDLDTISGPFRVHPDGNKIVFIRGIDKLEVLAMENFLSTLNTRK